MTNNVVNRNNKTYTINNIPKSSLVSRIKVNREYLLSRKTADELNTYRTWGEFPMFADMYDKSYGEVNGKYEEINLGSKTIGRPGVRSIFNKSGAVAKGIGGTDVSEESSEWRISNNIPLMDSPAVRWQMNEHSKCSIKDLVQASEKGIMGAETYAYSDFMYCKHLGKLPNSYLITLRRFPIPVDDHISSTGFTESSRNTHKSKNPSSIGCMVTWMGTPGNEMSSILKYDFSMPFEFKTAEWESVDNAQETQTPLGQLAATFNSSYAKNVASGTQDPPPYLNAMFGGNLGNTNTNYSAQQLAQWQDKNKVYGPVDAVKGTYMRGKNGLEFGHSITLTFDYELRSYDGINPRQAMLDLLSNILNVTYSSGTFWGGGYLGVNQARANIFNNLEIFKSKGGFSDFIDAMSADADKGMSSVKQKFTKEDGSIDFGAIGNAVKSFGNQLGGMILGGFLNKLGRPQKIFANSLLSPAPTGFWHVTIGNPKHPIMSLGNMILKKTSIEHYGPLGLDEFPTGLKVVCELERGKPRDIRDIEKIYMNGNDRIYHSMTGKVEDMYRYAKEYKGSKNHSSSKGNADTNPNAQSQTQNTTRDMNSILMKYFGTVDRNSILMAAEEQEWGSQRKKSK